MKLLNTITIEGSLNKNDRGTHEWGTFRITSQRCLSKETILFLCSSHLMGGQSFSVNETKNESNYIYQGSYDCWSD
jgi:hypothetical protein